jgi:hypothetical protein
MKLRDIKQHAIYTLAQNGNKQALPKANTSGAAKTMPFSSRKPQRKNIVASAYMAINKRFGPTLKRLANP